MPICSLWRSLLRKSAAACSLLSRDPRRFRRAITGTVKRFVVYCAAPELVPPPPVRPGWLLRKLTDEEVVEFSARFTELRKQVAHMAEVGSNQAYGVFCDGELAHVSWLMCSEHARRLRVRLIRLHPGDGEIASCYTLQRFRGRGAYPFAVRSLCQVARERGLKRIYMVTGVHNLPSRRGIENAGLKPCGYIARVIFPFFPHSSGWIWRLYRNDSPAVPG